MSFFLIYTCGLTVVIKRICKKMLRLLNSLNKKLYVFPLCFTYCVKPVN